MTLDWNFNYSKKITLDSEGVPRTSYLRAAREVMGYA